MDKQKEGAIVMASGYFRAGGSERYRDLEELLDYREFDGQWTYWFEEHWLAPSLRNLGYEHIRFFGGRTCEYDGRFRERLCELKRPGHAVEYYVYG